ncbi:putative methyltransferase-domain-containing protein [Mycena belliarum]|uniref:Methyltransferase-domain-containing protein n=1 Tax=Mycena belliarum TaxID=1033014 RepID=A0AAD6U8E8_9AGAR|nr:putative methyltransferase-domain-containing protein [Mycena belliae]
MLRSFLGHPSSTNAFWRIRSTCRSFNCSAPRTTSVPPLVTPPTTQQTLPSLAQKIGRPSVRNQVLFVVLGSTIAFTYAATATNIETDEWLEKLTRGRGPRTWPHTVTSADMKNASDLVLAQELRQDLKSVGVFTEFLPGGTRNRIMRLWAQGAQSYLNVSEGKRLCWKICLLNIGIWLAWKSKRFQPFLSRNFVHDPLSGRSVTMLNSMFSPRLAVVLGVNLLFLDGFGELPFLSSTFLRTAVQGSSASFHLLQRQDRLPDGQLESTARYHFLAFFISAGLFAALTSHIIHLKILYPRLIKRLSLPSNLPATSPDTWASALRAQTPPKSRLRSFFQFFASPHPKEQLTPRVGGTGALYALIMLTALGFPSAEIALFYPPNYSLPVQWGAGGLILLDLLGIWRGWRFFDHFAHLGGAAFGAVYYVYVVLVSAGPKVPGMFFYISFLRPPPTSCSNAISITLQIANDLRTELFEGVQDIYYSWLSVATGTETKPVKLTTWRGQSSAYKEIPVPLPRSGANGAWRLVLGSSPTTSSGVRLDAEGALPFGVMSMPILLGKPQSNKGKAKLQDQIERVYSFGEDRNIRIIEQTSFDLDKASHLRAGTGIVSIVLGALRPDDHIIATDVESAMPLLEHNIGANDSRVQAAVLDWDSEAFPDCVRECEALDIIMTFKDLNKIHRMADVAYNTSSFGSLVQTLNRLVNSSSKRPRVIMGYKVRDESERALWAMVEAAGMLLTLVGRREGAGGMPVEIWESQ